MSWVWIDIERRYADPGHAPDWTAEDRPPWTPHNEDGKRAFADWVSRQLDELQKRVEAEREGELQAEMTPELLAAMAQALRNAVPALEAKIENVRLAKPKATINDICEMERLAAIRNASGNTGRGRPASGPDPKKPAARAARDIWRIRHVILPRFWPEGAKAGWQLTNRALAEIAAPRYAGAKASAAEAWYENERLGSLKVE